MVEKRPQGNRRCPSCGQSFAYWKPRWAETPPSVADGETMSHNVVIGRTFYHLDGIFCDETFYRLDRVRKPSYLRLGDRMTDPRVTMDEVPHLCSNQDRLKTNRKRNA
jgi:hypothetical protein